MPPLDPFKYNPNYDSIYKKIRSFKIIDPKKTLNSLDKKYKRKHKYKSTDIYNNKKHSNKRFITDSNIFSNNNSILKNYDINKTHSKKTISLNTINNINNNENGKLPKLIKLSKDNNNESINLENENHALRFSKYIPRKYNVPENNENISYINPINYIKPKNKTKSINQIKVILSVDRDKEPLIKSSVHYRNKADGENQVNNKVCPKCGKKTVEYDIKKSTIKLKCPKCTARRLKITNLY